VRRLPYQSNPRRDCLENPSLVTSAPTTRKDFSIKFLIIPVLLALAVAQATAAVSIEKLPEPGLQPQVQVALDGVTHLIYLTGEPKSADIVYRKQSPGETKWSDPLRVNNQPGSAMAVGTIRGAQLALGRNGLVHVAWFGSQPAASKQTHDGAPMFFARLNDDRQSFSPQKDVMTATRHLDGGGSVAADAEGRVFVMWHGSPAGSQGETNRAVFLARSTDDGNTFALERPVSPAGSGACGCCGLTAFANPRGEVFVLFRAARSLMQRDMTMLVSSDHGEHFKESFSHPWSVGMCPMSSANLTAANAGTWAAWETAGRVHFARFSESDQNPKVRAAGPLKEAKHPRLATNARGETLVVWTEGTGWQRGGSLAWQVFDAKGEPTAEKGKRDGIPAWSFAAAYARPDGNFVILH
jgi:hypothetical protein